MDVNKILSADVLDIIFDGRNKAYGAYDLRRTYAKRMTIALIATAAILVLFFVGTILANKFNSNKDKTEMVVQDVELEAIKQEEPKNEPPPPAPTPHTGKTPQKEKGQF